MIAEVHSVTTCGRQAGRQGGKEERPPRACHEVPASSVYGSQCLAPEQALSESAGGITIFGSD